MEVIVTVTRQCGLNLPQFAIAVHHIVNGRAAAVGAFLRHMGDFVLRIESQLAIVRLELAQNHREQRRLATAVRANDAHPLPGMCLDTDFGYQDFGSATQGNVCKAKHGGRDYRGIL